MPLRAIALLSGGLDSMLAIRILQLQGVQIEALNFRTQFACCRETAARAARLLDVPLTVLAEQDDYLDVVRRPKFGYGRGANPCVDCRIYMFQRARAHLANHRAPQRAGWAAAASSLGETAAADPGGTEGCDRSRQTL
jgi:tRNA U34 2-thiouridine synthase MnmA/TrmU